MFLKFEPHGAPPYMPKLHETVYASRSAWGPFTQAVITAVRPRLHGRIRINWVWLEDSPPTTFTDGYRAGERGYVYVNADGSGPVYFRRIEGPPPPLKVRVRGGPQD